jgi:hypothetical protein
VRIRREELEKVLLRLVKERRASKRKELDGAAEFVEASSSRDAEALWRAQGLGATKTRLVQPISGTKHKTRQQRASKELLGDLLLVIVQLSENFQKRRKDKRTIVQE